MRNSICNEWTISFSSSAALLMSAVPLVVTLAQVRATPAARLLPRGSEGEELSLNWQEAAPDHLPNLPAIPNKPLPTFSDLPSPVFQTPRSSLANPPPDLNFGDDNSRGLTLEELRFLASEFDGEYNTYHPSLSSVVNAQSKVKTENPDREFGDFVTKGKLNWDRLQNNLRGSSTPSDLSTRRQTFKDYYFAKGPLWDNFGADDLHSELLRQGLGAGDLYQGWMVDSLTTKFGSPTTRLQPPYGAIYNPSQGVIIVLHAIKQDDEQKKLYHSDVLYQTLAQKVIPRNELRQDQASPKSFSAKKLSTILHRQVINIDTEWVISSAYYQFLGFDPDTQILDNVWRSWTPEGPSKSGFMALCGTDNVKGAVHMLNDYRAELGWKTIKEIRTWRRDLTHIWITLEDSRPGKTARL